MNRMNRIYGNAGLNQSLVPMHGCYGASFPSGKSCSSCQILRVAVVRGLDMANLGRQLPASLCGRLAASSFAFLGARNHRCTRNPLCPIKIEGWPQFCILTSNFLLSQQSASQGPNGSGLKGKPGIRSKPAKEFAPHRAVE